MIRAPLALDEQDRGAVEGQQSAQLLDERRERHVEVERRAERARAAARRLEHVDPPPELVAQPLRLGGALLGGASLAPLHLHEPPDDAAERERDQPAEHERVDLRPARRTRLRASLSTAEDRHRERDATSSPPRRRKNSAASSTTRKSSERSGWPGSQA